MKHNFRNALRSSLPMAIAVLAGPCKPRKGPMNPGFESGNLEGWEVVNGDAFGNRSVTNVETYWDGPFNQDQSFFILGTAEAGEAAVGELKSSSFKAASVMSFLVSGGYDPEHLYVGLVSETSGKVVLKQTGFNDEAFIRIVWDTSEYEGQPVHLVIHDSSTKESWGHINFDDVRVGPKATGDGDGLTFHILGEANFPALDDWGASACELFDRDPLRPQYHYTQYQGWINDPAGLIQWNGQHHLFSQYHPDSPLWGPMHWSHARSDDGVHWRELPVALRPKDTSIDGDESGRFTGSAFADDEGLHLLLTDFTDLKAHPGQVQETVIVASSSDGETFEYFQGNPVVPGPPEGAPVFFRDPKAFFDPTDNKLKFAIGATNGVDGQVRIYESENAHTWVDAGVGYTGNRTGELWECPNLFPLQDDTWALFYGGKDGLGFYETGLWNGSAFTGHTLGLIDAGPASYAMQWYADEKGRNLGISWMGNWPTPKWPSRVNGWAGQQSVTRELFLREDGGMGSRPIHELESLAAGRPKHFGPKTVGRTAWNIGRSTQARLKLDFVINESTASSLTLSLFKSSAESVELTYDVDARTLTLDTKNAGYAQAGEWSAKVAPNSKGLLSLDVFLDRSVVEIFVGDGTILSAQVWPKYQESTEISLAAKGGRLLVGSSSLTPLGSSWC